MKAQFTALIYVKAYEAHGGGSSIPIRVCPFRGASSFLLAVPGISSLIGSVNDISI